MTDRLIRSDTSSSVLLPRKRKLLALLLFAAAVVLAWAGLAFADALHVARELRAAKAEFVTVANLGLSARGGLQDHAAAGVRRFQAALDAADGSRWLSAWARVPLIGRPARWLRIATAETASLSRRAAEAIQQIEPHLESFGGPDGRLAFLRLLDDRLGRLRTAVDAIRLPSTGWYLPPINAADRELRRDLTRLRWALSDGVAGARALTSILEGPSNYLVLASNNAEMRAGGMALQAGILESIAGRLVAGDFRPTADLFLKQPVALPPEIESLYGWLSPGREWRNVGSSPNFPVTAPIYAAMADRIRGWRVDGVLQIDVIAIRALLDALGPVEASGRRYDAANVERLIMHDLYVEFGAQQVERRREFSGLAAATFQALNDRPWRLERMARALRNISQGRHLLVWSRRPVEQEAWRRFRLDGSVSRDGLMLTVQNHTGNKLDWFLRPSMDLRVAPRPDGRRRFRLRIRIENPTPPGEPPYVAGDGSLVPPGSHRSLVALYLPGWAADVEMPRSTVAIVGADGDSRVIGTRIDIARGQSVTIEVAFSAPPGVDRLLLLPSGRARPVPMMFGPKRLDDERTRIIPL